ncbi:unnamed protein product, partial [Brenthis ino]
MSFKGKIVLVTGASSGIGAATAAAFSSKGARVALIGRNEAKLSVAAKKCDKSLVIRADVSKDEDCKKLIDQVIDEFGQLDVLVNNAGISTWGSLLTGDVMKAYDDVMNVNIRAAIYLTKLAAPHLIKTQGNVVNISSVAGHVPSVPPVMTYCISKAALNHFGQCAAVEMAPHGVRVNTVSPGPVETDILKNSGVPGSWDDFKKITILDRVSDPEEIADVILFLASDKARGITGSNYITDNGTLIKRY